VAIQRRHLVAKQEKLAKEMADELCLRNISFTLVGSLTCRKISQGTDGFTFPPKEVVLRIFIALRSSILTHEPWVQWQVGHRWRQADSYLAAKIKVFYYMFSPFLG
jgi:hypothetical protein